MNRTNIEWVKNPDGTQGYTWNPITGCLNHTNGMCNGGNFPCYAWRLANGRLRDRYLANKNIAPIGTMIVGAAMGERALKDPFHPRFWEDRLINPITDVSWSQHRRWGKQAQEKGIFVCDMGELFGDWIPEWWQEQIFETIKKCTQHRFYLLTKQPQNLIKFSPFPDNCWVGVTATNQKAHNEAVAALASIEANIKFISHEPLLEHISLPSPYSPQDAYDWDIIGSQTKPYRPPAIEDVQEIVEAADKAGVPVFLKENLMPLFDFPVPGLFSKMFPAGRLELRQEMPK